MKSNLHEKGLEAVWLPPDALVRRGVTGLSSMATTRLPLAAGVSATPWCSAALRDVFSSFRGVARAPGGPSGGTGVHG